MALMTVTRSIHLAVRQQHDLAEHAAFAQHLVYSPQYLGHRIEPYAALAVC